MENFFRLQFDAQFAPCSLLRFGIWTTWAECYLRLPASNEHEIFYLINVTKGHLGAVEGVSVKYDLSQPNALSATRSEGENALCVYSQNIAQFVQYHSALSHSAVQLFAMQYSVW